MLTPNNLTANLALPKLTDGVHTLAVNAREPYIISAYGYYNRQETVSFTIKTPSPSPTPAASINPNPSPTLTPEPTQTHIPALSPSSTLETMPSPSVPEFPLVAVVLAVVAVAVGALVYFKKRKRS